MTTRKIILTLVFWGLLLGYITPLQPHLAFAGIRCSKRISDFFASRRAAFRAAKADADVTDAMRVGAIRREDLTDAVTKKPIKGPDGLTIQTRLYDYYRPPNPPKYPEGKYITIQEHGLGHKWPTHTELPHFNVRPTDKLRTGTVDGTLEHYTFGEVTP